jgi:hypothetical protein
VNCSVVMTFLVNRFFGKEWGQVFHFDGKEWGQVFHFDISIFNNRLIVE